MLPHMYLLEQSKLSDVIVVVRIRVSLGLSKCCYTSTPPTPRRAPSYGRDSTIHAHKVAKHELTYARTLRVYLVV